LRLKKKGGTGKYAEYKRLISVRSDWKKRKRFPKGREKLLHRDPKRAKIQEKKKKRRQRADATKMGVKDNFAKIQGKV